MPDEKRIKDFEPATDLLIDDWFAVDSPSQGTRKMQASMFQEGLQTQITTNTENIALHSGQISVLQQGVGNIGNKVDVLDAAVTVEEYSASKLYAVGEDCVYEGVRYKCITAIETPEAFDPNKWQAISIEGELNELNSSLDGIKIKYISSPLTIPDGTISSPKTVKVDISTFLPQGTKLIGIIGKMDDYPFPYVSDSGLVQTWLFVVGNTVQIKNITSGWGTRILHLIILYR